MVGVKLWVARPGNTPELDPIVEHAAELKAPVLQHTYIKATGTCRVSPPRWRPAELAQRHPKVPFICAHTGGDWEVGIRAIRDCQNVSVDLCGTDPTAGFTEMAVRELGAERVLYGSDAGGRQLCVAAWQGPGRRDFGVGEAAGSWRELKRLLMPILKRKGVAV